MLEIAFQAQRFKLLPVLPEETAELSSVGHCSVQSSSHEFTLSSSGRCLPACRPAPTCGCFQLTLEAGLAVFLKSTLHFIDFISPLEELTDGNYEQMTNCCHYFWYSFDFATFMQQWIGQASSEAHISRQNFHSLHVAFTFSNLDRVHLFLLFTFFFFFWHILLIQAKDQWDKEIAI